MPSGGAVVEVVEVVEVVLVVDVLVGGVDVLVGSRVVVDSCDVGVVGVSVVGVVGVSVPVVGEGDDESLSVSARMPKAMAPRTTMTARTMATMPSGVLHIDGGPLSPGSAGPPAPSPPSPPPPPPPPPPSPPFGGPLPPGTPGSTTH